MLKLIQQYVCHVLDLASTMHSSPHHKIFFFEKNKFVCVCVR